MIIQCLEEMNMEQELDDNFEQADQLDNDYLLTAIEPPKANSFVIGVIFVQDNLFAEQTNDLYNEQKIGTIILNKMGDIDGNVLRECINRQLKFKMDENFIFLTKFGSPLLIAHENCIRLNDLLYQENIVKFKRKLFPDRCSLIAYDTNNSIFISYIKASYQMDLKTIRTIIDDHLKKISMYSLKMNTSNYHFLKNLDCLIFPKNESNLTLLDIIRNNSILIKFEKSFEESRYLNNKDRPIEKFEYNNSEETDSVKLGQYKNTIMKLARSKTFKTFRSNTNKQNKLIMISYVRREAAEHAKELKSSLVRYGFTVYLDVHEIQMGSDWQDSINAAVQNCNFFVPLITQNYGRTQWTNREIKLADHLNKHIIPISFLSIWPPECLAIQFATTQYIPFNTKSDSCKDNIESIKIVTERIADEIAKYSSKVPTTEKLPSPINGNKNEKNKTLIVISAHPEQKEVSEKIKSLLLNDFDVWCSVEIDLKNEKEIFAIPNHCNLDLTTIPEEPSISRVDKDYARRIAENSYKQRPKSENLSSQERLNIEKKDLTRLASYGQSSYSSSISPNKLERIQSFHNKVKQAPLVIIIASEQYYKSTTSNQQVYFCSQRIKTILVQYDDIPAPVWFSKLMSHDDKPLSYQNPKFKDDLLNRINRIIDPYCKEAENMYETKIKCLADCIKKNIPELETCVYVFGTTCTSKLNCRTVEICEAIGKELAMVRNINIVTNGFYGTGDIVAHRFYKERCSNPQNSVESVIHILPNNDENHDGQTNNDSKPKVSYGQTLFLGDSGKERDSVIARMLDTTVLIGGDENAARVIEEFIWNDHFVIPIKSTGGAASGENDVPQRIFSCPQGVRQDQWDILLEDNAEPKLVASAVVNVICDLKKSIHEHATKTTPPIRSERPMKKRVASRRKINDYKEDKIGNNTYETKSSMSEKFLPTFETTENHSNHSTAVVTALPDKESIGSKFEKMFRNFKIFSKN